MSDPVRVANFAEQVSLMRVNAFDGTRVSMAERIVTEGFRPVPSAGVGNGANHGTVQRITSTPVTPPPTGPGSQLLPPGSSS